MSQATPTYQALLVVSFGGPERPADVIPFLENVLRGKNVPLVRMLEVAHHYEAFGGVSPINAQNRALIANLVHELNTHGPALPVYWGNRNWHPLLADTLRQMADDGVRRALALVTSAYSSYSGCRQYLEDLDRARQQVGDRAPEIDKLRVFYNHPGFIEPQVLRVREALASLPVDAADAAQSPVPLLFTAHSIPLAMAERCQYVAQLQEACRLVVAALGTEHPWRLVYQSRSGPPTQPWLEPDIGQALSELHASGQRRVVVVPIGFLSDHMEILFDLDTEARQQAESLGLTMQRARTVGTHPQFVRMIRQLILERLDPAAPRLALGTLPPSHDVCPADCCNSGRPAVARS